MSRVFRGFWLVQKVEDENVMKYKVIHISALDPETGEEELNSFCATGRTVTIEKKFVENAENSYWSVFVTYKDRKSGYQKGKALRVDYREVLEERQFAVFAANTKRASGMLVGSWITAESLPGVRKKQDSVNSFIFRFIYA